MLAHVASCCPSRSMQSVAPVSQWLQGSILTDPKDFPWNLPDAAHRARAPVALALLMLFPAEVAWLLRY